MSKIERVAWFAFTVIGMHAVMAWFNGKLPYQVFGARPLDVLAWVVSLLFAMHAFASNEPETAPEYAAPEEK